MLGCPFTSLTSTEVLRGKILVPTLEIGYGASFKNHSCPPPELPYPAPLGKFFAEGAGPCQMLGSWRDKSVQAGRSLFLSSSGTHSRFPAPSLHPSLTFVTAPHSESLTTLSPLTVGRGCAQHRDHRPLWVGWSSERLPCPGPASRQSYVPNVFLEHGLV